VASPVIGGPVGFAGCDKLKYLTLDETYRIGADSFLGCALLKRITYLGTKSQWASVIKETDWDVTGRDGSDNVTSRLEKILCYDGDLVYDDNTNSWIDKT
jgi:hypothetical protein